MHRRICLLLCLVLLMTGWTASFAKAEEIHGAPLVHASTRNGMVRVYLSSMGNPTRLDVTIAGSYSTSGNVDLNLTNGETVSIAFNQANGEITMNRGGQSYAMGQQMAFRRHAAKGSNGLRIAQTRMPENLYPGDLHLVAQKSGSGWRLYAIVHVYIENYLYGVVPYEMGNSANMEALKAQAVAARTYTLNKMNLRANNLYDVVDTTNDQVYYGNSDTTANCTAAVDATRGIVAMNGDKLTGTYYTASNGGQTESAGNGLNASGYAYLGVKDDPFDLMNNASVKRQVTVLMDNTSSGQNAAVRDLLNQKAAAVYGGGVTVSRIHTVVPHTPMYASPSRLYTKMDFDVTLSTGRSATLTLDIFSEMEKALGMSINSRQNELWTVETYNDSFRLVARRFGHGVGMSQRGAMQMGSMGYTYDQILSFYYEDCYRVRYAFTHTILSSLEGGKKDTLISTELPADITNSGTHTATVRLAGVNDRLAIRFGASENAQVLTSVVNGGIVTVLAKGDNWTLVQLGQVIGYVPNTALKFNGTPPATSGAAPTAISQWATVHCNGTLNMRTSPGMNAGVKASIPDGAVLCVFDTQNGWAQVQYGAQVGWASMDFLKMSSVYPAETTGQGSMAAVVNIPGGSGTVNLRQTASTTSGVISTIRHGSPVTVLSNDGSWCYVRYGGYEGFVMLKYLSLSGQPGENPDVNDTPTTGDGEVEAIVKTASGTLNLREEPSTAARVLMTIPRGESIIVTHRGTEWCAVRYGGVSGHVMTKFLTFPADENVQPQYYAVVATQSGSLNMRSQPTTGSGVVRQIPQGARVGVISQENGWSRVSYDGQVGYVMSSYLRAEGDSQPETTGRYATVTTASGSLNLRETASASAKVLLGIPQGTVLEVQAHANGWAKVSYGGATGYVMDQFLTFTTDKPQQDAPATSKTATVNTGGGSLNLREMAQSDADVLLSIPDGAEVELLIHGAAWCKITYNGVTGYVVSRYLEVSDTTRGVWYVNTPSGGLNLRETASADARVLLSIPGGTAVTMLEEGAEWCRIQYNDSTGYVMTKFLKKE
ncbi:MAG: SH3 domain-containing protein [Clostridia bacterium]|nr:SH3 domain-containing protein [Clostridia bacterium]